MRVRPTGRQGSNAHVTVQDRPLKGAWGMTALLFLFMLVLTIIWLLPFFQFEWS